jgi:hypothetical protein
VSSYAAALASLILTDFANGSIVAGTRRVLGRRAALGLSCLDALELPSREATLVQVVAMDLRLRVESLQHSHE